MEANKRAVAKVSADDTDVECIYNNAPKAATVGSVYLAPPAKARSPVQSTEEEGESKENTAVNNEYMLARRRLRKVNNSPEEVREGRHDEGCKRKKQPEYLRPSRSSTSAAHRLGGRGLKKESASGIKNKDWNNYSRGADRDEEKWDVSKPPISREEAKKAEHMPTKKSINEASLVQVSTVDPSTANAEEGNPVIEEEDDETTEEEAYVVSKETPAEEEKLALDVEETPAEGEPVIAEEEPGLAEEGPAKEDEKNEQTVDSNIDNAADDEASEEEVEAEEDCCIKDEGQEAGMGETSMPVDGITQESPEQEDSTTSAVKEETSAAEPEEELPEVVTPESVEEKEDEDEHEVSPNLTAPQHELSAEEAAECGIREDYILGETARSPSHTIIEPNREKSTEAISSLADHDFAFVKRSYGTYTYAVLACRSSAEDTPIQDAEPGEECMTFVLNNKGCTKVIKKSQWSDFIRLVSTEPTSLHTSTPIMSEESIRLSTGSSGKANCIDHDAKSDHELEKYLNRCRQDFLAWTTEGDDFVPPSTIALDAMDDISCVSAPYGLPADDCLKQMEGMVIDEADDIFVKEMEDMIIKEMEDTALTLTDSQPMIEVEEGCKEDTCEVTERQQGALRRLCKELRRKFRSGQLRSFFRKSKVKQSQCNKVDSYDGRKKGQGRINCRADVTHCSLSRNGSGGNTQHTTAFIHNYRTEIKEQYGTVTCS